MAPSCFALQSCPCPQVRCQVHVGAFWSWPNREGLWCFTLAYARCWSVSLLFCGVRLNIEIEGLPAVRNSGRLEQNWSVYDRAQFQILLIALVNITGM